MIDTAKIEKIVEDFVAGSDMFLVEINNNATNNVIEVVLDSDTSVSIDRCVEFGRLVNDAFDRDVEDFELTVSSAGIGRPLKLLRQYLKIVGRSVAVVMRSGEKITGTLTAADEDSITVDGKKLDMAGVKSAREEIKF